MPDTNLKIERSSTLRQQATEMLRNAILEDRFRPGEHLVERKLCDLLGVSRTSVREALRHLETEGLIDMVPYKGPVVATISEAEAREIYQVRTALEGFAGRLFAIHASEKLVKKLRLVADKMAQAAKAKEFNLVLATKSEFYEIIFEGTGNDTLADLIQQLNARVWRLRRLSLMTPNRNIEMLPEVEEIVAAAEAGDPERMSSACKYHIEQALVQVLSALQDTNT